MDVDIKDVVRKDGKYYVIGRLPVSNGTIDGKMGSWIELDEDQARRLRNLMVKVICRSKEDEEEE